MEKKGEDVLKEIKKLLLDPENNETSNIVKALLIGLIAGLAIGATGENWDFQVHHRQYGGGKILGYFEYYGTTQAIVGGIIVSLLLFLKYNKK